MGDTKPTFGLDLGPVDAFDSLAPRYRGRPARPSRQLAEEYQQRADRAASVTKPDPAERAREFRAFWGEWPTDAGL